MNNNQISTTNGVPCDYEILTTKEAPYTGMVFYCRDGIRRWIVKPKKVYTEHNLDAGKLRQVSKSVLLEYTRGADLEVGEKYLVVPKNRFEDIKEVIIHIGMMKTATTSIQESLFDSENEELLNTFGYFYPKVWGKCHKIPLYSLFSDAPHLYKTTIRMGIHTQEQVQLYHDNCVGKLMNEISRNQYERLIFSAETLSVHNTSCFEKMKHFFTGLFNNAKIKIILCTREYVSYCISRLQEAILHEYTIEQYDKNVIKYDKILKNIFAQFKYEDVVIYKFEDALLHQYGPVGYFLSLLNIPDDKICRFKIIRANESRSFEGASLFSYMNSNIPKYIEKDGNLMFNEEDIPNTSVLNHLYKQINGVKYAFTQEQIDKIYELTRGDAKWLKETCGIDYSATSVKPLDTGKAYGKETIDSLHTIFPFLTLKMKEAFLDFFEMQYNETNDPKFLCLFSQDSIIRNIYDTELKLNQHIQPELRSAKKRIESLKTDAEKANNRANSLKTELNSADKHIKSLETELNSANNRIESLEADAENSNSHINSLESDLNSANNLIVSLQTNQEVSNKYIKSLESDLNNKNNSINSLETELDSANARINSLELDAENASNRSNSLETELSSANNRIESLEADAENANSHINSLESDLNSANNLIVSLQTNQEVSNKYIKSLESDLNNKNNSINSLETELDSANARINSLELDAENASNRSNSLETELSSVNNRIESLEADAENANSHINSLESDLNNKNNSINALETELDSANARINSLELDAENANSHINVLETELSNIYKSKSWKITQPVRAIKQFFIRTINRS